MLCLTSKWSLSKISNTKRATGCGSVGRAVRGLMTGEYSSTEGIFTPKASVSICTYVEKVPGFDVANSSLPFTSHEMKFEPTKRKIFRFKCLSLLLFLLLVVCLFLFRSFLFENDKTKSEKFQKCKKSFCQFSAFRVSKSFGFAQKFFFRER